MRRAAVTLVLFMVGSAIASAQETAKPISESEIKWAPAPPFVPPGAQVAVMSGDPSKEGPWVMRMRAPADYVFPAHSTPAAETITVLSGLLYIGVGDTFDRTKAKRMAVGSFVELPGKISHYSWNPTEVIVEVHSIGPSPVTYANPADDPSKK
jgi:quercetin dioxygenase-like cupin family protein